MIGNYEKILERISRASGIDSSELDRRVEAKRAKLSGLISKEGAAQVVAAELGINFDNEKLKINELLPGMRKVNLIGKVLNIFPVRTFTRNGKESKVANMIIADDTSNIRMVLWDMNHINLIEEGRIAPGIVVEVTNGSMRDNEVHLGSFSELKPANVEMEKVVEERVVSDKEIKNVQVADNARLRAFIVQSFEPKFFYLCPECNKKAVQDGDSFICEQHGKVAANRRALITLVLDDGTETMRAVVFSDNFEPLGLADWNGDDAEKLAMQRQELLGKELLFSGNVRKNKYFDNTEFSVSKIEAVEPDALIKELEGK